jgi:hypothetical protein
MLHNEHDTIMHHAMSLKVHPVQHTLKPRPAARPIPSSPKLVSFTSCDSDNKSPSFINFLQSAFEKLGRLPSDYYHELPSIEKLIPHGNDLKIFKI